jgi:hypothetical protein
MNFWDDPFGRDAAPQTGSTFNPDTIELSMRDDTGGVHKISIGDLAKQFNAASKEMVSSWEYASPRDLQHMDIEIKFNDRAEPLKENFMDFLDRHREEIALFQLAHEAPEMLTQFRRDPRYAKYGL